MYCVKKIRSYFPIFKKKNRLYLDNAASTYKPISVINKEYNFYKYEYLSYNKSLYSNSLNNKVEYTRKIISKFINSNYNEIIFTKGATESINLVSNSLLYNNEFLKKGDNIIISNIEHHSNFVTWKFLLKKKNIEIKILPINKKNGYFKKNFLKKIINNKTKFISITHVSNVLGVLNDIEEIICIIKNINKNILVLVDGSQAISHIKVDVKKINCDFYVFSGHKMYGPLGIGILYGKKKILDKMKPWQLGGSIIKNIYNNKIIFVDSPWKFETGTMNSASVIGINESIKFINKIGINNIYNWENKILEYSINKLKKIKDIIIYCDNIYNKLSIISFNIKNINCNDIGFLLKNSNIYIRTGHQCSIPIMNLYKISGVCRISYAMYTNFDDIDFFIENLKFIKKKFF
ncbi:cysteine desulfurase [endosymbiont of Euscepes postfasciatus]|uniref:aminotransferase class V-fold PLP-dependent enzyme n=1 Tax=endosymbiont of Euscepes postfasciatus TaxID=650377 RepID=UPI000DC71AB9|nr:aminotransferase class V-fold PLP-dependent enzyme [endosymbiont of Euscepes postfasciatus]BBA84664.1 cysteine desulfurase [endosymbiont of Euscepes postfasciatus]